MESATVIGVVDGQRAEARWQDGSLTVTGPAAEVVRIRVEVLVAAGRDVVLAGIGGGSASVAADAGQIVAAGTLLQAFDDVSEIVFDPEIPPLPPGAVA